MTTDQWLDLSGVVASALVPLTVVVLAFMANRRLKHFEQNLERKQKISDRRFDIYKEIGFNLNDIYAYFMFVGQWKEQSDKGVIEKASFRQAYLHIHANI